MRTSELQDLTWHRIGFVRDSRLEDLRLDVRQLEEKLAPWEESREKERRISYLISSELKKEWKCCKRQGREESEEI